MPRTPSFFVSGLLPGCAIIVCFATCGCERSEQITTYSVPKHESLQSKEFLENEARRRQPSVPDSIPIPKRMIGVVIPHGTFLWFLKLEGPVDAVAAREKNVREFLKTLSFSKADTLEWTLPDGWQRKPATEMREATLVLDGLPTLELSVTKLPSQPEKQLSDQVLANVNRWRGQLTLQPLKSEEAEQQIEKLTLNDLVAYVVNLEGVSSPKPGMMSASRPPVAKQKESTQSSTPEFVKPAEWVEAPPTMFAKVSLQAQDGDARVTITVTPARGSRDMNVNRWRGQVKLEELTPEQMVTTAKKVTVGTQTGDLYEMTNGNDAILGVIVEDPDQMWFVKLSGDRQLAERERPRFEAFLKSLQLGKVR